MTSGAPGKPKSPEHRAKLAEILRKRNKDPEFRKIVSDALKGKKFTEEHKANLRGPRFEKRCPGCNKIFFVTPCFLEQKYCSKPCVDIGRKTWPRRSEESKRKQGEKVKKRFEDPLEREKQSLKRKGRKLSEKDHARVTEMNRKKAKDPNFLANLSKSLKGKRKSEAFRKSITGEGNHQWRGGLRPLAKAIRDSIKYSEWRLSVYKRDNFCDWFSGLPGNGNLIAHHRDPFNNILRSNNIKTFEEAMACEALWDVNNGVTMFKASHEAYHQMWGNDTHPNGRQRRS